MRFRHPLLAYLTAGGVFVFALANGLALYFRLANFRDPPGMNGYFYLKQAETLALHGSFYFRDHSLAFLPLVLLRWLTGDSLLAFQLASSAALALLFGALLWLVAELGRGLPRPRVWFCQVLVALGLASSSYFAEFSLNFYKNSLAYSLLIFSALALFRGRRVAAGLLFLFAFLTHKSVALAGLLYLLFFLKDLALEAWKEKRFSRRSLGIALASLGAAALFTSLFLWHFPKAAAFAAHLGSIWQGPGPKAAWYRYVFTHQPQRAAEILAFVVLLFAYLFSRRGLALSVRRVTDVMAGISFLALQPFQASGEASVGYRLLLMAPFLCYPLSVLCLPRLRTWPVAVLALFLPLFFSFSPLAFAPAVVARQVKVFSPLREAVARIPDFVGTEDYLVSHHGLEFFVDYVTGIRSRSFVSEAGFPGRRFRLAYAPKDRFRGEPLRDELNQSKLLGAGPYILLHEEDWQQIASSYGLPRSWRNPQARRPAHVYQ